MHTTLHDRRLEFLRSKKENQSHSEFLRCLEERIDLCDYKNWSRDAMVSTLFLTFCDIDMGKIVTEQMSREALNMTELRAQVRSLESCPWYKGPKNSVKLANSSGHGGSQESGEHQDGVPPVKGIRMTQPRVGGLVHIVENEVISQRSVATDLAMVEKPRRQKKPKKLKKHRKKFSKLLRKRRTGRRGSAEKQTNSRKQKKQRNLGLLPTLQILPAASQTAQG